MSFAQSLLPLLRPALPSCLGFLVLASTVSYAQRVAPNIIIPSSSIERAEDIGRRVHTMHVIRVGVIPAAGSSTETPQSLRALYKLPSTGGSGTIAIIGAFHYPTAERDLNVFAKRFGLPSCTKANGCLRIVYAAGTKPPTDCGWSQEAALDTQWAHAMAPGAKIVLVEAASNMLVDMFKAVDVATSIVTTGGKRGQVSMSWGTREFAGQSAYNAHFQNTGVVYFAASGDMGGITSFPSVSPYVVSAGGTSIQRSSSGAFLREVAWSDSGGGRSRYEPKPSYQNGVGGTSATKRSSPDFSFNADPNSGVLVYDSTSCGDISGWMVFGGTSVSTPALAGIVNLAGKFRSSSFSELSLIYANRKSPSSFRDITSGSAGAFTAHGGYDFITGVGSNQGLSGK